MKKLYSTSILLFLAFAPLVVGQAKTYSINHNNFSLETHQMNDYESDRISDGLEVVDLYRGKRKLLSHILFKEEGDCSSVTIQLGDYFVENNNIIFYSYWASADRMPSNLKFGFQKQVYSVADNGIVRLESSKIYIEDVVETANPDFVIGHGWTHRGIAYLNKQPTTDEEKMWLADYIKSVEKQYKAKFVFGEERKALEKEVREKLKEKIFEYTNDWDTYKEAYGESRK
ncbi:MAG: hypothetical protein CSA42_07000 [Gammaproteobacteria bacterium]|nr:MAG: hypothetical protein CSA42_07000 [Gammaproteobacteria bacterium]